MVCKQSLSLNLLILLGRCCCHLFLNSHQVYIWLSNYIFSKGVNQRLLPKVYEDAVTTFKYTLPMRLKSRYCEFLCYQVGQSSAGFRQLSVPCLNNYFLTNAPLTSPFVPNQSEAAEIACHRGLRHSESTEQQIEQYAKLTGIVASKKKKKNHIPEASDTGLLGAVRRLVGVP